MTTSPSAANDAWLHTELHGEDELDENGARVMSKKIVYRVCRARGEYATPSCHTVLYLNDLKFRRIQNLEASTLRV